MVVRTHTHIHIHTCVRNQQLITRFQQVMSANCSKFGRSGDQPKYKPKYIRTAKGHRHEIIPGAGMTELWYNGIQYIQVEQEKDFWGRGGPNGGSELTGNYDLYLADTEFPFASRVGTWNRWRREITPPPARDLRR